MWRRPQDNKIASLRQIWPTSEPSHKYDKTGKYGHLGAQSSGMMTRNWWSHKRRDHTRVGIRHNHQRGCGSPTFSPLWRRFWLCRLFPVQWIENIALCALVTAHWHPHPPLLLLDCLLAFAPFHRLRHHQLLRMCSGSGTC